MKNLLENKLIFISNILFYSGLLIGAYGIYIIYKVKLLLPEDVCTVDSNRIILTVSIVLLITSIIIEWIGSKRKLK